MNNDEKNNDVKYIVLSKVTEDLNTDPEADSNHFMIVIIESLSLLGKIPEALEVPQLMYTFLFMQIKSISLTSTIITITIYFFKCDWYISCCIFHLSVLTVVIGQSNQMVG